MLTETGHPLCADNFGDYLTWDFAISLARGTDHAIEPESPLVNRLLSQVERAGGEYRLSREDAAEILTTARTLR